MHRYSSGGLQVVPIPLRQYLLRPVRSLRRYDPIVPRPCQRPGIRACEALAQDLGLTFRASGATTPGESMQVAGAHPWQGCHRPWSLTYITANGTVLPCCIAPFATADFQQIVLGKLFEQPLAQIWNDRPYRQLRAAVLSTDAAPWPCQHCGVRWSL